MASAEKVRRRWWHRRPAPDIRDVPCLSCQRGYGKPHVCELPEFCACDQWRDLHVLSPDVGDVDA